MTDLAKEIIQTNIEVWGEGFLITGMLTMFAIGAVVTLFLVKRNKI
jgi:hypothetical protein